MFTPRQSRRGEVGNLAAMGILTSLLGMVDSEMVLATGSSNRALAAILAVVGVLALIGFLFAIFRSALKLALFWGGGGRCRLVVLLPAVADSARLLLPGRGRLEGPCRPPGMDRKPRRRMPDRRFIRSPSR